MDRELQHLLSVHGAEELTYRDKFLGDENIQHLCEKLKIDEKKKLILRGNYISTVGAKAIAELLRDQNSLVHVSLEWNQIGPSGAEYFANALLTNRSLYYLDLRNNYINSDAAIAFASAVMKNPILKTLDLRWNQIEDRGALAFKSCILDRKPSLQLLIHGNLLSEATIATINEWLKKGGDNDSLIDESLFTKPKQEELPPRNVTVDLLQKEIAQLRSQINQYQANNNDLQRQLDNSLMKITELEQLLSYEKHENLTLNETLKQLTLRVSMCNDELVSMANNFDKERASIMNEMLRIIKEKENEIRDLSMERDQFKERCLQLTVRAYLYFLSVSYLILFGQYFPKDENEQLKVQHEHIKQQMENDHKIAVHELKLAHQRINDYTIAV
jgi:hypothetical protein